MRKRVDPRVKTLVEHCVLLHQRAFLVIIGDRGAEQVVNLHYLLQQLCAGSPFGTASNGSTSSSSGQDGGKKGRCSVLWCYKKDLGFSSHRKKRSKQLKKKMQRGLYDPCRDDPFELFLSSTEIRYCYYKETHAILGSTYTMLVLQDFEALTPNILCRTIETVQGGGLVCLLLRSFSSLQQLYGLCMDFHARLRPIGAAAAGAKANDAQAAQQQLLQQLHEVQPRFNERFFLSLTRCRNCLIVDDELNVLPLTSFASHLLPLHQHAVAAARAAATGTDAAAAAAAAASAAYAAALEPAALGSGSSSGKKKGSTSVKERETLVRRQQQILAENEKQRMQLVEIRQQFRGIPPVGPLVDLCVTPDQAKAVLAFLDCLATASASTAAATPAAASGVGRGEAAAAATAAGGASGGAAVKGEHNALRTAATATAARRRIMGFETFALTAARGRGKSAALGLAVAGAIAYDYSNIFVCAPGAENVKTLFEFVVKGLTAVGLKEHVDFTLKREDAVASAAAAATAAHSSGMQSSSSSNLEGGEQQLLPGRVAAAGGGGGGGGAGGAQQLGISRLILGVEVQRRNALHKQTVSFLPAAAAAASGSSGKEVAVLNNADLLVIDEAASIPIPVVKALFGPYVVLFSSTVNGYEGTGRALSLKLIQDLRQNRLALQQRRGAAGCFRCLREISLLTPIRYAAGDGVEAWLHDLLCLDATQPPKLSQAALPPASRCSLYLVDRDALFSYHAAAEKFLHALLSLFVSSHYKNSPNDLLLLADAPAHLLFVLLPPIHDAATLPDIYCAIQVAIEGALSKQAIRQALGRGLRPSGDLLPWTLSQHFVDEDFGCLTGARIVRIACHPSLQRMGYGSAALQQLIEYFEKKNVTLQDPLCCSPAVAGPSVAAAAGSDEEEEESDEDEAAAAAGDRETEGANAAEDVGDVAAAAAAACSSPAEAGRGRRGSDLLNGEGRASGEAAAAPAAGANSKLKKGLKKPGTAETSSNGASPPSPRSRNASSTSASAAADEADTAAVGADSSAADPEAAAAKAFVASLSRKSLRKRSTLPPLLLPCSSSPPAFRIHYFGVAFGLTAQLFRFWNRKHFIPVYLRHVPTDVTGEHSCIMLRPAIAAAAAHPVAATSADQSGDTRGAAQEGGEGLLGREDGSWVVPFAVDFRARLLQLLAGCFRSLPSSLSLCLISSAAAAVWRKRGSSSGSTSSADPGASEAAGAAQTSARDNSAAVFPPVTLNNLHEFLSAHDVLRLRKYAQQLADLPLILDLLPTLAALFFNDRLPAAVTLSPLQQAVLLAVGAQRKNPDVVATEYNIPYNQTLALLSKTVHKFSSFFQRMQEEAVAAEVEQQWGRPAQRLVVEGGDALLGDLPPQSFAEELQESSRTVNRLQKEELQQLINSFGKDAVGEFSMESISNDDFKAALRGRCPGATPESSTVLSLKRKNFAKDYQARKSSSSNAAQAAGPKAEGNNGRKQLKRKRPKA